MKPRPTSPEARRLADLLKVGEAEFALAPHDQAAPAAAPAPKSNRPGEQQRALDLD